MRKRGSNSFLDSTTSTAFSLTSSRAFLAAGPRRTFGACTTLAFLASGARSSSEPADLTAARAFAFLRRDLMFRTPVRMASLMAPSPYTVLVCGREEGSV